ncbi:hypothetical protein [Ensifer soli]|uniref:hypothetical protein n=1 Tax=Ciceribacter sp. sgz301302 TaxID=3342379 RepID=UPI0035B81835
MPSTRDALSLAVSQGIISAEQAARLTPLLDAAMTVDPRAASQLAADGRAAEEAEQPRFIRGFHDILMTIGVVVAISGLWGIGSIFAVLPAIVILSEILVRRQRLALPAVALTVSFVIWIGVTMALLLDGRAGDPGSAGNTLFFLAGFPVLLAPYCWRYRVPVAFAALILSVVGIAVLLVLAGLEAVLASRDIFAEHRLLSVSILLVAAIAVFAVAMAYDMSDPARLTRRSDIAFWLHLAAAPSLLYGLLGVIFVRDGTVDWWGEATSVTSAWQVLGIVALLMAIGLLIDRRAFVTSGLISLGIAIATIVRQSGFAAGEYAFVIVFAVGAMVLAIGLAWQALRRHAVGALPPALGARLHPVR